VKEALEASRGRILVTGSLFLVGEALQVLGVEL
jgi:folylpolyglutamate synthase/dihydropteroate synthase